MKRMSDTLLKHSSSKFAPTKHETTSVKMIVLLQPQAFADTPTI